MGNYITHIKDGLNPLVSMDEIINTTKASFAALKSLKESKWIEIS